MKKRKFGEQFSIHGINRIQLKDIEATQREFINTLFVAPLWRRCIFALQIIFRTGIPEGFKWFITYKDYGGKKL